MTTINIATVIDFDNASMPNEPLSVQLTKDNNIVRVMFVKQGDAGGKPYFDTYHFSCEIETLKLTLEQMLEELK